MRVEIKASKTYPFHKGMSLTIGQALQTICPVCAMKEYLDILPCSLIPMGDDLPDSDLQVNLELSLVVWASVPPIMQDILSG